MDWEHHLTDDTTHILIDDIRFVCDAMDTVMLRVVFLALWDPCSSGAWSSFSKNGKMMEENVVQKDQALEAHSMCINAKMSTDSKQLIVKKKKVFGRFARLPCFVKTMIVLP